MGKGSSGKVNRGGGIKILQGAVAKAKTSDLMSAYRTIENKAPEKRTNEEKMVRATAIDELAQRGALIYDPKTEGWIANTTKDRVVFNPSVMGRDGRDTGGRSYRIHSFGTYDGFLGSGKTVEYAVSDFYYNGSWHEVKNPEVQVEVAELARKQKRRK